MNCLECRELIQCHLDGNQACRHEPALDEHLKACNDCRELVAAARCLVEGLREQAIPFPPAGLSERIGQAVLLQSRRRTRLRRATFVGALAASIFAILNIHHLAPDRRQSDRGDGTMAKGALPQDAITPSLNRSVEEAGQAVLAMTRRAADETVGQGRIFLPQAIPEPPRTGIAEIEPLLRQPTQSLREFQDGMTAALEPVTSSARRAMDLFLRELPAMDKSNKRGS